MAQVSSHTSILPKICWENCNCIHTVMFPCKLIILSHCTIWQIKPIVTFQCQLLWTYSVSRENISLFGSHSLLTMELSLSWDYISLSFFQLEHLFIHCAGKWCWQYLYLTGHEMMLSLKWGTSVSYRKYTKQSLPFRNNSSPTLWYHLHLTSAFVSQDTSWHL